MRRFDNLLKTTPWLSVALVSSVWLSTSIASAWQPIAAGNPVWRPPVPYSLNQAGSVDLGGFGNTETEVQRGMDDWSRVSCTSLTTSYQGSTPRVPGTYEGVSVIGWIESGWRHGSGAIGVTGPRWSSSIIEADMEMNGVDFTWTTASGSFSNVNAYSIILHEGGHYYGLGHTNVRGSTMWPSYSGGIVGLGSDDENGICALYPGGSSDCTVTGCPSGQECVDGACQTVTGDGSVCAPCDSRSDCDGGACLLYPDGAFCGRPCSSDADCDGDVCVGTGAGPQCVRYSGSSPSCAGGTAGCTRDSDCAANERCEAGSCVERPSEGAPLGSACTMDSDCNTGLCLGGLCTQSCDWTNPGSCPAGFYCDEQTSTSCDSGFCLAGTAGSGTIGTPCSVDTECASLFCEGVCTEPCIPGGGAAVCPAGYACRVEDLSCRGSCQVSGALGDGCATNDDCTSNLCADREQSDDDFCTRLCDEANPCPARFSCVAIGDASICVPDAGGLGDACESNLDCLSEICAAETDRSYCTRICDDVTPCPGGTFDCVLTADGATRVCQPTDSAAGDGGCGCRTAGASPSSDAPWSGMLLALLALWVTRRSARHR